MKITSAIQYFTGNIFKIVGKIQSALKKSGMYEYIDALEVEAQIELRKLLSVARRWYKYISYDVYSIFQAVGLSMKQFENNMCYVEAPWAREIAVY